MNLKKLLMDLGNYLVTEHGYDPNVLSVYGAQRFVENNLGWDSTAILAIFTEYINSTPEAIEYLETHDVEWPMADREICQSHFYVHRRSGVRVYVVDVGEGDVVVEIQDDEIVFDDGRIEILDYGRFLSRYMHAEDCDRCDDGD